MSKHHKIPHSEIPEEEISNLLDYPSFSFEFLTKQNEYSFNYFKHDLQASEQAKAALIDKFLVLSSEDWTDLEQLNKRTGFEMIPAREVKISLDQIKVEKPTNLIVFRFDQQRFRLIGFKIKNNPVFYILGFDFDYDAYNHG